MKRSRSPSASSPLRSWAFDLLRQSRRCRRRPQRLSPSFPRDHARILEIDPRGAQKAADDTSFRSLEGPTQGGYREDQIKVVEDFVTQGVSGIVLAPLDTRRCARPVAIGRQGQHSRGH